MLTRQLFSIVTGFLLCAAAPLCAQEDVAYKTPPKTISDMLLAKPAPNVNVDEKGQWMLLTEVSTYPSVEELAQPELRIAGLRINPKNYSPSRQNFINNLYLKNIATGKESKITGLPVPLNAGNVRWSPTDKKIAFTNTLGDHVDLYVIDIATLKATKINKMGVNAVLGASYQWYDDNTILYKGILAPAASAPPKPIMPKGPTTQENYGKAAPQPTFQDLIKSPHDEQLFGFYAKSQLVKNVNGVETKIGLPAIYASIDISPDKKYLLTRTLNKPFSYLVTANRFASTVTITDLTGKVVKKLVDLPSGETTPSGRDNVQNVPRGIEWRDDEAATVVWCMPLDSGMIKKNVEYHDAVYALSAPFTGNEKELFKTKLRYYGTSWGNANLALVTEGLGSKQMTRTNRYNPSTGELSMLMERNTTDAYGNPGLPVTEMNQYNRSVIKTIDNGSKILMNNPTGASPKGDLPFLATLDLNTKKTDIIWRCPEGTFESVVSVLDADKLTLLTRREDEKTMPNYWLKDLKLRIADRKITNFTNPYPQLDGVSKEKITYKRADGVDLTGDLYLPKGYDPKRDGPLPTLIWAYPREFNSAADAAQIRGSEHRFTLLNWGSPIFYVTQGYAVLNNAEMPIVATDPSKQPNDNFVDQVKMNAEAAVNKLAEMGVGDRNRMAVGGHSYGAFMTANLLAHTNLFKGGIARSGAYNRTLTPFGFQNEDRTYWQNPDLYHAMSPFSFADKIKTPILLIHGEADNNTGTYPIQSERMFNAIKGHGGTVKFVSLPHESHGYAGRENILHMLQEQFGWLEKYVKNANVDAGKVSPKP
ncbi:MAG: prolyl oligopeptidase family serine peptidase [Haliscomenobacter sp.]|uniref:S9 family peptidase n=1 Tax=Haliscomenobacter sp. TaxID=2717303 RepID=UPI0029B6D067|nr:prolyl oligopeptidase family serine peptidase [Haliscomenobacter sp.]MDX2072115.1 prolyl oligopeptidase family serine peptidase [Haliscomenobacter sp.]